MSSGEAAWVACVNLRHHRDIHHGDALIIIITVIEARSRWVEHQWAAGVACIDLRHSVDVDGGVTLDGVIAVDQSCCILQTPGRRLVKHIRESGVLDLRQENQLLQNFNNICYCDNGKLICC